MFEVIFSRNNLSRMHISAMWHSWNVYKYFCPLSVYRPFGPREYIDKMQELIDSLKTCIES